MYSGRLSSVNNKHFSSKLSPSPKNYLFAILILTGTKLRKRYWEEVVSYVLKLSFKKIQPLPPPLFQKN